MTFIFGFIVGAGFAYTLSLWLYRDMRRDERWWQENEGRRNHRWPVLSDHGEDSDG